MGFDIECIIDIHTYPGEYFCPVCRTLVYPNEAFQSQCTHLYCKPCLAHIANGSRACPYDGYLVTESDSKPLMDSDKALAENIGKVKVHCLYFRSGCTWEGTLSDCTSHCSSCSFGNSPVICNRCGIQIVHRQVHDHAQSCPGAYGGQPVAGGASGVSRSGTTVSTANVEVNLTVSQSGAPSQVQNSQNAATTPVPGQNPNLQANANSQAPFVAPVTVPSSDQWYHQQYQQYYQQYMGYDPYQQTNQPYYPIQQPLQQYQQQPVQVQGQHQSQGYSQAMPHPQIQPQPQPQQHQHQHPQIQPQPHLQAQAQAQPQPQPQPQQLPVSQAPQQPHLQPQSQGPAQPQPQLQSLPQVQLQVQIPPQVQAQGHVPAHSLAPNYQVNPQQPPHPPLRPQTQIAPQALPPPPHNQSSHPPAYAQAIGMRPPAQHAQVPQYPQPHVPMQHQQSSQGHVQPQMQAQPQPAAQPQSSNLPNMQIQPQVQPYLTHSQPSVFPTQANQSTGPMVLPQVPHSQVPPVSGHHSYQPPQSAQKMQPGSSHQHPGVHQATVPLHPAQAHGQVPQQPAAMRPPPQVPLAQQQPLTVLPPHNQVPCMPPAQHQQIPPHVQQPTHPLQNHPVTQQVQRALPQQYSQQQHFLASQQSQVHHQGYHHQQSMQPQLRSSGPPQQQQSQNYVGRPMMSSQGIHPQSLQPSSDVGPLAPSGPAQLSSTLKTPINQNYSKSTALENNASVQETVSPSKGPVQKGSEQEIVKVEVITGQNETGLNEPDNAAKDVINKSIIKLEEDDMQGSLVQTSGGKSFESGARVDEFSKVEGDSLRDSDSLKQVNPEQQKMKLPTAVGPSSANYDKQSNSAASASGTEGHMLAQQSYGSHEQRPELQAKGQPPSGLGQQGPGILSHPGQSYNQTEGKAPGYYGPPPKSFKSQATPHGPALTTPAYPPGIGGRSLPLHVEGQMLKDQMSGAANPLGSGEGARVKSLADGPSFLRMNGGAGPDSAFGSKDEKIKALTVEHLNPFPGEPTRPFDQASRSLDKASHGPIHEAGMKMNPGPLGPHPRFLPPHNNPSGGPGNMDMFGVGPEFGQHHIKHLARGSPDREYFGSSPHGFGGPSGFPRGSSAFGDINSREAHRFGEGSRSFNPSSGPVGNPFRDGRYPAPSGILQGGDIDGSGNHRFGDDVFGPDGPDHFPRGRFSGPGYMPGHFNMVESAGPGTFPGHGHPREMGGPGNFPRLPFSESVRGDRQSFAHFGEPAMQNYSLPAFPNTGSFSSGVDSLESRKRKPVSAGWCRICEVDCNSVEGLDFHSQTREHQKMAMDMVKTIKLQNQEQRSGGQMLHEGGRSRKIGIVGRGSKP